MKPSLNAPPRWQQRPVRRIKHAHMWTHSGMYLGRRRARERNGKCQIIIDGKWKPIGVNVAKVSYYYDLPPNDALCHPAVSAGGAHKKI